MRISALKVGALALLLSTAAGAETLERVKESGVFKIGFREDAAPYSYKNSIGEPAGYSVELCRHVATNVGKELDLSELAIDYVPVTTEDRFEAIAEGRIDILCGATTATLSRRELVDFSVATFVDGASVLLREDGPENFEGLAGKRVGVRAATTTEQALRITLERLSMEAEIVAVESHEDGLQQLQAGDLAAYFADRAILIFLVTGHEGTENLRLSDRYFTNEPYALALALGDNAFRLVVDGTLSRIYRSGDIKQIFASSFGSNASQSDLLKALYVISALPE